jgi:hypothetical protein
MGNKCCCCFKKYRDNYFGYFPPTLDESNDTLDDQKFQKIPSRLTSPEQLTVTTHVAILSPPPPTASYPDNIVIFSPEITYKSFCNKTEETRKFLLSLESPRASLKLLKIDTF